jgi:hypothetical protein
VGLKWNATLDVEFEMEEGQSENLAKMVLKRQAMQFQNDIERGLGVERTGVKQGSAKVEIVRQGSADWPPAALEYRRGAGAACIGDR